MRIHEGVRTVVVEESSLAHYIRKDIEGFGLVFPDIVGSTKEFNSFIEGANVGDEWLLTLPMYANGFYRVEVKDKGETKYLERIEEAWVYEDTEVEPTEVEDYKRYEAGDSIMFNGVICIVDTVVGETVGGQTLRLVEVADRGPSIHYVTTNAPK